MSYARHGDLYHWTLGVAHRSRAGQFFGELLGWELDDRGDPANIRLSGSLVDEPMGFTFYFWVDDVEAATRKATDLGAVTDGVQTGRSGQWSNLIDPNGVHVSIGRLSDEFEAQLPPERSGGCELAYFVIPAAHLGRGREFYHELLGWTFEPGDQYAHCSNVQPAGGLNRQEGDRPQAWFHVSDIHAAVALTRERGGTAEEPSHSESGWSAACTDGQGTGFNLWQPERGL